MESPTKYFCRYFTVEITDGIFPSVIRSVITDRITDGKFRINEKRAGSWRRGFGGWFFRQNHRRIKNRGPVPVIGPVHRQQYRQIWNARSVQVTWPVHRQKYRRNHRGIWKVGLYGDVFIYRYNYRRIHRRCFVVGDSVDKSEYMATLPTLSSLISPSYS